MDTEGGFGFGEMLEPKPLSAREWQERLDAVFGPRVVERRKMCTMQVAIDRAAVHISELPVGEWVHWVGYAVEAVESLGREFGASDAVVEEFIGALASMLMVRASSGSW